MGFIREKEKAGSVGFVETAEELFGLCYVATRKLVLSGSSSMRQPSTGMCFESPSGPLLTGEGLCHVEFQESNRRRSKRCAFLDGCKRVLLIDLSCPFNTFNGFSFGDVLLSRCHGPPVLSLEVLTLFFLLAGTTPYLSHTVAL